MKNNQIRLIIRENAFKNVPADWDSFDTATFCFLAMHFTTMAEGERIVRSDELSFLMNNHEYAKDKYFLPKISRSIECLIARGIVCGKKVAPNTFQIDCSRTFEPNKGEHYFRVLQSDLLKVWNLDFNNRVSLLHLYVLYLSYINHHLHMGFAPLRFFATDMHVSEQTVSRLNRELEEAHIIYIQHSMTSGKANRFTLYENRELLMSSKTSAEVEAEDNFAQYKRLKGIIVKIKNGSYPLNKEKAERLMDEVMVCNYNIENSRENPLLCKLKSLDPTPLRKFLIA